MSRKDMGMKEDRKKEQAVQRCGVLQCCEPSAVIVSAQAARILGFQKPWSMLYSKQELQEELKTFHQRLYRREYIQSSEGREPAVYRCELKAPEQWIQFVIHTYEAYSFALVFDVSEQMKGKCRLEQAMTYNTQQNNHPEFDEVLQGKIRYAYQPIVEAATGEVFAYEALMRPQGRLLTTPEAILHCAQDRSQLERIEIITWQQAIAQFAGQCARCPDAKLFINSLPQVPFAKHMMQELEEQHADILPRIVMELLEAEVLEKDSYLEKERFLKRWGAQIAIDDFGSGYNQELRLLQLTMQYIKIDSRLIDGIAGDELRQELVQNIITFAHHHDIRVIAEGIETQADMRYLLHHGIDLLQGYYIGRPQYAVQDIAAKVKREIQKERQGWRKKRKGK